MNNSNCKEKIDVIKSVNNMIKNQISNMKIKNKSKLLKSNVEIVDDAVNSAKILDASVTSDKLAASIHRTTAGENMVFDANGATDTGLFLTGTDQDGNVEHYQVVVQGGMLQLKQGSAQPAESGATSTAAAGADA